MDMDFIYFTLYSNANIWYILQNETNNYTKHIMDNYESNYDYWANNLLKIISTILVQLIIYIRTKN